jgi:hypothetical protein
VRAARVIPRRDDELRVGREAARVTLHAHLPNGPFVPKA